MLQIHKSCIINDMNQGTIITIIGALALIVAGMFTVSFLLGDESEPDPVEENDPSEEASETDDRYENITRIDAKHFYEDGEHTFAGEIMMPTPCDLLEAETTVAESMPEQVSIDFTVVNTAEACAQVVTPQRFMVTASASEEASVQATFMGRPVELNLLEPEPGETPEDFELFIKG